MSSKKSQARILLAPITGSQEPVVLSQPKRFFMKDILGQFTRHNDLTADERRLVQMAMNAPDRAHCFRSNFPVGSAVLAANEEGMVRMFHGCNVENDFFPATICAERNAVTTAVMEGYRNLQAVALFCRNYPGGSPPSLLLALTAIVVYGRLPGRHFFSRNNELARPSVLASFSALAAPCW